MIRLNKYIASAGISSRRNADNLIKAGEVTVNGKVVCDLGTQINEKKDKVKVSGKEVLPMSSFVYIKFNKPRGCVCSAKDERGRKTIYDYIKVENFRLFSVGRLDYDTEGLLLLTNDGEFANMLMHPSFEVEKEYKVTVEGKIQESDLAVLRAGVVVDGERMPKCSAKLLSCDENVSKVSVVIHEGQNRQVRRMFEAIGKNIKLLKRIRIGSVKLGGMSRGEFRDLTSAELCSLKENKNC